MRKIYTSVDFGTDSIKIVVCELYRGKYNLLAATSTKSEGIKKGLIIDSEEAKKSLVKAVSNIEDMVGFKLKKVIATIPSYLSEFTLITGHVEVNDITINDINRVIKSAALNQNDINREIVTVIPIDYKVDGNIVSEPIGLSGNTLAIRALMATTHKKNIYSVVNLLNMINIDVIDISFGCIGDINVFKDEVVENNITAVINIGYEKTEVSLYNKGIVVKHNIIAKGSSHVDSDIAYMYRIDTKLASELKEKFAYAGHSMSGNDIREVLNKQQETIKISQSEISEVASSRILEILTLSLNELNQMTNHKPVKIFVTGGMSNMMNFEEICREKLGNCAIIGNVNLIGIRNNKYVSAFGNIVYFVNKLKNKEYTMISEEEISETSTKKENNDSLLGKVFDYFFGE